MSRTSFGAGVAVASLISATLAGGAFAATPTATLGDAFADALVQSDATWTAEVDTAGATLEPGEAFATDDPSLSRTGTVWLSWTAPSDASIALHATGAHQAIGLALYTGTDIGTAEELAFSATGEVASADVVAGTTYRVQVSTIGAADVKAPLTVELSEVELAEDAPAKDFDVKPESSDPVALFGDAPPNDRFAAAIVPTGSTWTNYVNNEFATTEVGERVAFDEVSAYRPFGTVWLRWVAPASGAITLDTYGSATDETTLAVFTGTKVATAARVAVNDDANAGDHRSRITSLPVTKGVAYSIQVGSSATSAATAIYGSIQVNLNGSYATPSNDNMGKAPAMVGSKWVGAGTTIGSTIEPGFEQVFNPKTAANTRKTSVWWKWTAIAAGTVDVTTIGSTSTIYAAAYSTSPNLGFSAVAFDEDVNSHSAELHFTSVAGTTYFFQAGDITDTPGTVKLQFATTYTGPYLSKMVASSGKLAGGNVVTITGTHLASVTKVAFGGIESASIVHKGETQLLVKVPAGVSRKRVPVQLFAGTVRSSITTAAHYTYK